MFCIQRDVFVKLVHELVEQVPPSKPFYIDDTDIFIDQPDSVGVVLSRLEERDLVRHRGEYWAISDAEDIDKTLSAMATARAATDRLGSEDPDEWGAGLDDSEDRE